MNRVCILGGSGFVGRHLIANLSRRGIRCRVLTHHPQRHASLRVLPGTELVKSPSLDPAFLISQFEGCDAVINLIGILNEARGKASFRQIHVELVDTIVAAAIKARVGRLLHMSALHASADAPSHYLRTKAQGEDAVHRAASADFHVTSFRPSVIFGPGDGFLNRFAALLRLTPGVFPLACPDARFQPVSVEDVVGAFVESLDNHKTFGERYDLCGPKTYTLRETVAYVARVLDKPVCIIGLNDTLSYLQALSLEFVPGKPFSLDNYRSLQIDSVCDKGFPEVFGITPGSLEEIAPDYLRPHS